VESSSARRRFAPPILDHDPFAQGAIFNSRIAGSVSNRASLASQEPPDTENDNWPSPIVDESDPVDVMASALPFGSTAYFTPEINTAPPDSTGSSSAVQWLPVETTSGLSTGAETDINWRFKQQLRRRGQRVVAPADALQDLPAKRRPTPMQFATILPEGRTDLKSLNP